VTADKGMQAACSDSKRLLPLLKVEDLLDLLARQEKELSEFALEVFSENKDRILKELVEEFSKSGFILVDEDGDVEEVQVNSMDLVEELLLDVSEDAATFQVTAKAVFEPEVEYGDVGSARCDREDDTGQRRGRQIKGKVHGSRFWCRLSNGNGQSPAAPARAQNGGAELTCTCT
jgi:hypothetical protein